ncbi:hypothetical protein LIER_33671 [Lithospermum erythrorhizon]|uniref:Uncharacterized protein n=1 Tax=Lithospermum erythrorhizon TaxID=34254 RepID=A0AAV3RZ44_LITER
MDLRVGLDPLLGLTEHHGSLVDEVVSLVFWVTVDLLGRVLALRMIPAQILVLQAPPEVPPRVSNLAASFVLSSVSL